MTQWFYPGQEDYINKLNDLAAIAELSVGPKGDTGDTGPNGLSAYEEALANGFVGTEAEWLASLVGPAGPSGAASWDNLDNKPAVIAAGADAAAAREAIEAVSEAELLNAIPLIFECVRTTNTVVQATASVVIGTQIPGQVAGYNWMAGYNRHTIGTIDGKLGTVVTLQADGSWVTTFDPLMYDNATWIANISAGDNAGTYLYSRRAGVTTLVRMYRIAGAITGSDASGQPTPLTNVIGHLSNLQTTTKTSFVEAINELKSANYASMTEVRNAIGYVFNCVHLTDTLVEAAEPVVIGTQIPGQPLGRTWSHGDLRFSSIGPDRGTVFALGIDGTWGLALNPSGYTDINWTVSIDDGSFAATYQFSRNQGTTYFTVTRLTAPHIWTTDNTGDPATVADVLATKQDTLVSGTNIKTINGDSLLGAGNLAIATPVAAQDAANKGYVDAAVSTIPQNSKSAAYTLVLADAGKHIFHPSADTTARTFTIPANASVAYPIGTAITFVNQNGTGGVVSIAITSDTMRLAGAGTTGTRTLARNGVATAIKIATTEWIISGTGLT